MGDVIRDGLLLAVRRPLFVLVLPIVVTVGTSWLLTYLLGAGYGFEKTASAPWVRPDTVLAMPLLAMIWVGLAWDPDNEPSSVRERMRRGIAGVLAGTLLCLTHLLATELTFFCGALILFFLAPLVSVVVCESVGFVHAIQRSVALTRGSRWRLLLAWGGLELGLLLLGLLAQWVVDQRIHWQFETLIYDVGLRAHAGLRWGVTMAVYVAAYRRLRISRAALDVDAWVEVFR